MYFHSCFAAAFHTHGVWCGGTHQPQGDVSAADYVQHSRCNASGQCCWSCQPGPTSCNSICRTSTPSTPGGKLPHQAMSTVHLHRPEPPPLPTLKTAVMCASERGNAILHLQQGDTQQLPARVQCCSKVPSGLGQPRRSLPMRCCLARAAWWTPCSQRAL
jgi:hypothetical protein